MARSGRAEALGVDTTTISLRLGPESRRPCRNPVLNGLIPRANVLYERDLDHVPDVVIALRLVRFDPDDITKWLGARRVRGLEVIGEWSTKAVQLDS